jgi:hypothetical protein
LLQRTVTPLRQRYWCRGVGRLAPAADKRVRPAHRRRHHLFGAAFVQSWLTTPGRQFVVADDDACNLNTIGSGYVFTLIARDDLLTFWWIYGDCASGLGASVG